MLFVPLSLRAQMQLSGIITDAVSADPVISAQISAYSLSDDKFLATALTDSKGHYQLNIDAPGAVRLRVSALFFASYTQEVAQTSDAPVIDIKLAAKEIVLQQIAIKAKRPIKRSSDTTVYDAAYFARGNEVVAEDLLRSIPGVSVDQSGKITIQGREVEKVMIDNDDFFEKGYRTLTRSLRASVIEQVEVLDNYSHQAQLKGFERSDRVALNLKLNDEAKGKTFGDVELTGDLASPGNYEGKLNLINLRGKQKFYFLLSGNNIGENAPETIAQLWQTSPVTPNSLINYQRTLTPTVNLSFAEPAFRFNRTVNNNLRGASLSGIINLGKTIKVKTSLAGIMDDRQAATDFTDYFRNDGLTTITNTRQQVFARSDKQLIGRVEVEAKLKNDALYTGRTALNLEEHATDNNLLLNGLPLSETNQSRRRSIVHRSTYLKKLTKRSALLTTLYLGGEQLPENYRLNQNDAAILSPLLDSLPNFTQLSRNHKQHLHLESHLFLNHRKAGKEGLELIGGLNAERYTFNLEHTPWQQVPSLSGGLTDESPTKIEYRDYYLTSAYAGTVAKIDYAAKGGLHLFQSQGKLGSQTVTETTRRIILPSLQLKYKLGSRNYLELNANRYFAAPTVAEATPRLLAVNSNLRQRGQMNLNPLLSSRIALTHSLGHYSDQFNVLTHLSLRYDHEYLSNQNEILGTSVFRQIRRFEGRQTVQLATTASKYFPGLRNSLKTSLGYTRSQYADALGGPENIRALTATNTSLTVELRSTFTGPVNYHFGLVMNRSAYGGDADLRFFENRFFSDLEFTLAKKVIGNLSAESIRFSRPDNKANQMWLLDGKLRYEAIKGKLTCLLTLRNLLNSRRFDTINGSEIAISETSYRLFPRQLLLGARLTL